MVSTILKRFILLLVLTGFILWFYCRSYKQENFSATETYEDFYNKLQSKNIELEDKCRIAKQRLQDKEDGINVDKNIINAAQTYVNDYCVSGRPKPKQKRIDIDSKSQYAIKEYYNKICIPEYGELRDRVEFDQYEIFADDDGNYYLDNERIDQIVPDEKKCRRMEEFVKNNPNGLGIDGEEISNNLEAIDLECRAKYPNLTEFDRVAYNFYLSKDGKYYINNEPLDQLKINKKNCTAVGQIAGKPAHHTIAYRNLSDRQKEILCKRNNELSYVCSKWDQDELRKWGKENDIGIELNEYEVEDDVFEYSFMSPSEHYKVSRNIRNGKTGLSTEEERALCYRKIIVDRECL